MRSHMNFLAQNQTSSCISYMTSWLSTISPACWAIATCRDKTNDENHNVSVMVPQKKA